MLLKRLIIYIFLPVICSAQRPTLIKEKVLHGEGYDTNFSMLPTPDGGFISAGVSSSDRRYDKSDNPISNSEDIWLTKHDRFLNKEWDKIIGGDKSDWPYAMCYSSDGNILICSRSKSNIYQNKSESNRGNFDYWLIKIDLTGNVLWNKTIGGNDYDMPFDIKATPDGGAVICGYSNSNQSFEKSTDSYGGFDYWIVKLDPNGNKIWDKTYGGAGFDVPRALLVDDNGEVYVGGHSDSAPNGIKTAPVIGPKYSDFWVIKLNSSGNKIWDKTYGGWSSDQLYSMAFSSDGNVILAGYSQQGAYADKSENSRGRLDFWLVKINKNGNKLWDKTLGGSESDVLRKIEFDATNNIIVSGQTESGISGDKLTGGRGGYDFWIIKLDSFGNYIWDFTVGSTTSDFFSDMIINNDNDYIISGSTTLDASGDRSENTHNWDGWFTKIKECPDVLTPEDQMLTTIKGNTLNLTVSCPQGTPEWFDSEYSTSSFNSGNQFQKISPYLADKNYFVKCENESCLSSGFGEITIDVQCPPNLVLTSEQREMNFASEKINSSVNLSNSSTYYAGKSIELTSGFQVDGKVFEAEIQTCTD